MGLNLTRPLVVFDAETTGTNIKVDRIIELAMTKIFPDGTQEKKVRRMNPEMPIPKEASEIHKIFDSDVMNEPTFKELSKGIGAFIKGCDLGGFNIINFDIPIMAAEFARCGITFPEQDTNFVDGMKIYHLKERRDLTAAYKFYCKKEMEGAHAADADTDATVEIILAQIKKYGLPNTVPELQDVCMDGKEIIDFAGWIIRNDEGDLIFGKGEKYYGKNKKILDDISYVRWMFTKDFPADTVNKLKLVITLKLK